MNRSDNDLRRWAREHLVYEAGMLAYTADRIRSQRSLSGSEAEQTNNVLIESFAVHARCLRDFLWSDRKKSSHAEDAFAADFCERGKWHDERGPVPPAIEKIDEPRRIGREIVHLSYDRLDIDAEAKRWDIDAIAAAIAAGLRNLARLALPERMDRATRDAVGAIEEVAAASEGQYEQHVVSGTTRLAGGGTIPFEGFTADE